MNNTDTKYVKCLWAVLCQSSVVDSQSNNVSLHNVLEQLNIEATPQDSKQQVADKDAVIKVPFHFQIVALWKNLTEKKQGLKADLKVKFIDPKGDLVQELINTLDFPKDKPRNRVIIGSDAILVNMNRSGEYRFILEVREPESTDFKEAFSIPLEVAIKKNS